jgi:hypothetical protein
MENIDDFIVFSTGNTIEVKEEFEAHTVYDLDDFAGRLEGGYPDLIDPVIFKKGEQFNIDSYNPIHGNYELFNSEYIIDIEEETLQKYFKKI